MSRLPAPSAWREGLLWKGYTLIALAFGVAYFLLGGNVDAQSAIYQLFIVAAPIAILVGVRKHRPSRRLPWVLFAGGLALWCVGDAYWNAHTWILETEAPYPSFADVAYLGGYPLLIAGGFVLVRGWGRPRVGDMLDLAIVALAAGTVSVMFLFEPLVSTSDPLFAKLIAVGFPVLDFVLLIAFTQLLFRRRVANFALQAIMVATGALVVADSVFSYLALSGAYTTGMIIDAGWLACYALWPIAALHPSMARVRSLPERERVDLSLWRIGALLVALLAAPIVLIVQYALGTPAETGEIGGVIVVTMLLVAARVALLQRDSKKAQAALAQADERLGLAQRVAGVSTWDIDLTTGELIVSDDLAALIMGSAAVDPTLQDWAAFVHPGDRDRVSANFDRARDGGGDFEQEYRFRSPNGTEGWLFARGRVFPEENGAQRAFGVVIDVTLRRWMEEQLQRSEEGMRLAQEVGGIGTWDTDLATGKTTWSQNLRRISGVADDVEGNHELFLSLVHPDDRAGLDAAMATAEDNGDQPEFEYRLVRPNGEVRWLLSRGDAVTGLDGRPTRFVGVAVDITHRHAMEEQLAHSEERLQLAQELGGVGTWDSDLETGETTWSKNLRRLSGVGDEVEESHESFMELVYPDDRAGLEAAMATAVADGDHFEFEYRLVRPNDGELRWMLSRGDAVTGPDGHSTRFLGVAVDITDRHLAEEQQTKLEHQLRQAYRAWSLARLGRFDEARAILAHARAEQVERGGGTLLANLTAFESVYVELLAGDPASAAEYGAEGCRLHEELGELRFLSNAAASLAQALYALDRLEEADAWVGRAAELAASDDPWTQMVWREVRGKVLARRGEHAEAQRLAREAVTIGDDTDLLDQQGDAYADLAEVLLLGGKHDEAGAMLEQALERYDRKGNLVMAGRMRDRLSGLRERLIS